MSTNRSKTLSFLMILAAIFSSTAIVKAVSGPFDPGYTLNPGCSPTDSTCKVLIFPDQDTNADKFLKTDGTDTSWEEIPSTDPGGLAGAIQFNSDPVGDFTGDTTNLFWDDANDRLGIGTGTPNEQLEITKNFRLPATTGSTVGVIMSGADRYIHDYGTSNFFAGVNAGNFTMEGGSNIGIGAIALKSNTTGSRNIAIGNPTLIVNDTGINNIAIGSYALSSNTSGFSNTAIGTGSLAANVGGSTNFAIGVGSLQSNTAGDNNFAIGSYALSDNIVGSRNLALGNQAGYLAIGDGNVFIGYQAGYNETGSDKLYIANSDTATPLIYGDFATGRVGIGTATPGSALDIKGTLRLSGSTSGYVGFAPAADAGSTTYTLPSADGTSGQVLSTDGAGTTSWATAGGGTSYSVYTALLTQSGTDAPIATVLENTIGDIVWTRTGLGTYSGTLLGAFTLNKTFSMLSRTSGNIDPQSAIETYGSTNIIIVTTWSDEILNNTSIEIRVYP